MGSAPVRKTVATAAAFLAFAASIRKVSASGVVPGGTGSSSSSSLPRQPIPSPHGLSSSTVRS